MAIDFSSVAQNKIQLTETINDDMMKYLNVLWYS